MRNFIIGNFGNHSLAVMQALIEKELPDIHFIYLQTGWAAASWAERIFECSQYAQKNGVTVHQLKAQPDFTALVKDRKQFPSRKFQWCASFLKGLPILSYLDELDPGCEAQIVSGKRRLDSKRFTHLDEYDAENELYQGRIVWHPLWQTTDGAFVELIKRTGFQPLSHPSLECSPCIHSSRAILMHLDKEASNRLKCLEDAMRMTMFPKSSEANSTSGVYEKSFTLQQFDLGCGAPWNCGE